MSVGLTFFSWLSFGAMGSAFTKIWEAQFLPTAVQTSTCSSSPHSNQPASWPLASSLANAPCRTHSRFGASKVVHHPSRVTPPALHRWRRGLTPSAKKEEGHDDKSCQDLGHFRLLREREVVRMRSLTSVLPQLLELQLHVAGEESIAGSDHRDSWARMTFGERRRHFTVCVVAEAA